MRITLHLCREGLELAKERLRRNANYARYHYKTPRAGRGALNTIRNVTGCVSIDYLRCGRGVV